MTLYELLLQNDAADNDALLGMFLNYVAGTAMDSFQEMVIYQTSPLTG